MAIFKNSKYLIIALTVAAIALTGLTMAAVTINQNVASSGTITTGPNVGVFSNSACTTALTSINWGNTEVGGTASQTVYVEDTGGTAMTLSISVGSWSPITASAYITVTWTGQGTLIQSNGVLAVTLTLTVASNTPGSITSFSNTVTISGTG